MQYGLSEAAPEAVRLAVGGGCRSGWGRLLSVANAIEVGTLAGHMLGTLEGGSPPPFQCIPRAPPSTGSRTMNSHPPPPPPPCAVATTWSNRQYWCLGRCLHMEVGGLIYQKSWLLGEFPKLICCSLLTILNYQISYVKHVLDPLYVCFTLFGCLDGRWGASE